MLAKKREINLDNTLIKSTFFEHLKEWLLLVTYSLPIQQLPNPCGCMKGCGEIFKCVKAELPYIYSYVCVEGTAVGHIEVEKIEPYLLS